MSEAERVLQALKITQGEPESEERALLLVERARVALLCYCGIPQEAKMPEGLFEAWCMLAEEFDGGSVGEVSRISEGDVTIAFGSGSGKSGGSGGDWRMIANRFRRADC